MQMTKGKQPANQKGSAPGQEAHANRATGGFSAKHYEAQKKGWDGRKYKAGCGDK